MTMTSSLARALPPPAHRLAAAAWSRWTGALVQRELASLARSGRPLIVGPWLGEVGFELLYWIPFLDWAVGRFPFDRTKLLVVSRGGTAAWYRHISTRYRDVFEFVSEDEFRVRNGQRADHVGEQKQVRPTAFEQHLADAVAGAEGLDAPAMLHPALMYRAFSPFWWGHRGDAWVHDRARFRRLSAVSAAERPASLPERYVAVKFYFNDAFPATDDNRACAERVVRELTCHRAVVSLTTGLRIDDHHGWDEDGRHVRHGLRAVTTATNLGVQSAIIAGAEACVGTYGGFAYLAPFHGVPMRAFYSNPHGFSQRHLDVALAVFQRLGSVDQGAPRGDALLTLTDVRSTRARAVAG
jgi:hypothetical protein